MKKIVILSGSPRKGWNTDTLCKHFAEGVKSISEDIEVEIVYLYDIKEHWSGCIACMGCKLKSDKTLGHCVLHDGIKDLLAEATNADGLVFASPIYFSHITGEMITFTERLFFPLMTYDEGYPVITKNRMPTATIYTMNCHESWIEKLGYDKVFEAFESQIAHFFTSPRRVVAYNTLQVKDYSRYHMDGFSQEAKEDYNKEHFGEECHEAFNAGVEMAKKILGLK